MINQMSLNSLLDKIQEKKAIIAILGLGRVGLPLSSVLANSGFNVLGIDVDSKRLDSRGPDMGQGSWCESSTAPPL